MQEEHEEETTTSSNSSLTAKPAEFLTLECFVWVTAIQLRTASRFCRVLEIDGTCKTNNRGYTLAFVSGQDGNNQTFTAAAAFLRSETLANYSFVWSTALPFLYGRFLKQVTAIISDGDKEIIGSINTAIKSNVYGNGSVYRRLCLWHRVLKTFKSKYGANCTHDGGVGDIALRFVLHCLYEAESAAEFESWWSSMIEWMETKVSDSQYTRNLHAILKEFVDGIFGDRYHIAVAYTMTRAMEVLTTSRSEAENCSLKRFDTIHNAAPLFETCRIENIRQEQRNVDRSRVHNYIMYTVPTDVVAEYLANGADTPLAQMTPHGANLLRKQIEQSTKYRVIQPGSFCHYEVERINDVAETKPLPWRLEKRPPRTVTVIPCAEGGHQLKCSCTYFIQFGIPCRHVIAVNGGKVGLKDVDPYWLKTLLCGTLDHIIPDLLVVDPRAIHFPVHRQHEASQSLTHIASSVACAPDSMTTNNVDSPSTFDDEEAMDPEFQQLADQAKELLQFASNNSKCRKVLSDQFKATLKQLQEYVSSMDESPRAVEGCALKDACYPPRDGPRSSQANHPAYVKTRKNARGKNKQVIDAFGSGIRKSKTK